jgi:acetyl esterase
VKLDLSSFVHAFRSIRLPIESPLHPVVHAIRYRDDHKRGIAPLADVYVPRNPTGSSAVILHGGAFVFGSRQMKPVRYLASRLCEAGVAACAIDYRLIFRGGGLTEALDDVGSALAFWQQRTQWLALDPARISLVGLSAGATLALLGAAREPSVSRVVGCFGLYDVDHLRGRVAELLPRLLMRTPNRQHWGERLPKGARHTPVPTLLLHGEGDGVIPAVQSRRLAEAREALGLPTRLVVYPDAPHGFFNVPSTARDEGVREIIEYVR